MEPKTRIYAFLGLDPHSAIIVQKALENRKETITASGSGALKLNDKILKGMIMEIDQIYDDLDRHIASCARREEYKKEASHFPPELS